MINLIPNNGKLSFEVNNTNISNENLKSGEDLLLLGGTEIDVRNLYFTSKKQLEKERATVQQQKDELQKLESEIMAHQQKLEKQQADIVEQQSMIEGQKESITFPTRQDY